MKLLAKASLAILAVLFVLGMMSFGIEAGIWIEEAVSHAREQQNIQSRSPKSNQPASFYYLLHQIDQIKQQPDVAGNLFNAHHIALTAIQVRPVCRHDQSSRARAGCVAVIYNQKLEV